MKSRLHFCTLLILFGGLVVAPMGQVLSAEKEKECVPGTVERKDRGSLIGERTYRRISAVHEQLGNEEYNEARKTLDSMLKGNLNDYETALVEQTLGYVYAGQGKYAQAVPHFERALEADALPNAGHFGLMYSLAQLYVALEPPKHQESLDLVLQYLSFQCDPPAPAFMLVGQNYASMDKFLEALPWVKKAIAKNGDKTPESWYLLELAIYFETRQYSAAATLLTSMVAKWPEKIKYWEMLSGAYQQQEKDKEALSVLMLAYQQGMVTEEKKILNVVRMNMFLETPFMAGTILDKEMAAKRVQETKKNLDLLLGAWTAAREFDRAIATIDRLAPFHQNGEIYLQKAQLLMEKGDWAETIAASRQAIDKGGLKKPGGAYLMIGIAANELRDWQQAMDALKKAKGYDEKTRKQANEWMNFVQDRIVVARN